MKKQFNKFLKSAWGLEVWAGGKPVFRSKKAGVRGLLVFIKKYNRKHKGIIIFDKIVGRGAALLAIYLRAKEVYGKTGSKSAGKTFRKFKVKFYFQKTVTNILNKEKTKLCPLEKLSSGKTPEEFYKNLCG